MKLGKGTGSAYKLEIMDNEESVESLLVALETALAQLIEKHFYVATSAIKHMRNQTGGVRTKH